MNEFNRVDLRVHLAAEDIASAIMVHRAEIEDELRKGVAQAMAKTEIAKVAYEAATRQMTEAIENAVRQFFWSSGEGAKAINAAIQSAALKAIYDIVKETR